MPGNNESVFLLKCNGSGFSMHALQERLPLTLLVLKNCFRSLTELFNPSVTLHAAKAHCSSPTTNLPLHLLLILRRQSSSLSREEMQTQATAELHKAQPSGGCLPGQGRNGELADLCKGRIFQNGKPRIMVTVGL